MFEAVLLVLAAISAITAAFVSFLCLLRLGKATEPITKELMVQLFREESGGIIKNTSDEVRASRTELIDSLLSSFRTLVDFIGNQLRTTGERLDEATKKIDERVEGIGLKLKHDLDQMDSEAHRNRDALRKVIEDKLDDSIRKQNLAAHDLREEMNSSFEQLGNRVSNTLTQNSTQQKERLEDTMTAITTLTDKHEKAQESLKQAVERKLDSIRQESWEKLDVIRPRRSGPT